MKNTHRTYQTVALAFCLLFSLILVLMDSAGFFWGSSCDWYAQHISLLETMRQTVYETGSLFPSLLPLGGGMNLYDFSYYGYLRPDLLLGCLLPFLPMDILAPAYALAEYLISALLFFKLSEKLKLPGYFCLWGSLLFLCAGCFFHLHRHLMFVGYMPFLLGALLAVMCLISSGKRWPLALTLTFIFLHSYYFSLSCFLAVFLFLLALRKPGQPWREPLAGFFLSCLFAVLMAALLLLPSAASILACADSKDAGIAGDAFRLFRWDFSSLLYDPYGCGLTVTCLFLLFCGLTVAALRIKALILLLVFTCGLVPLGLNGFLYARGKILIPFLPLVLMLDAKILWNFWSQRRSPSPALLLPTGAVALLQAKSWDTLLPLLDFLFTCLLLLLLRRRARKEFPRMRAALFLPVFPALICALLLHSQEDYLPKSSQRGSTYSRQELEAFCQAAGSRFDTFLNPYQTANRLMLPYTGRTSMYTSVSNPAYSHFYYDIIRNPIRINNRVALLSEANPFFQYLMGVRYLETYGDKLPYGYQVRQDNGASLLAENPEALPICYGSTQLLSQADFESLSFPETLEALVTRSVVPEDSAASGAHPEFVSHFRELHPAEGKDYTVAAQGPENFTVIPREPVENQILAVTFQVTPTSEDPVLISINGIRNKLSGADAPYPNGNRQFTYILSSPEPMDAFSVTVSGDFSLSGLRLYSLDTRYFGLDTVIPLKQEETGALIAGTITMPEDGYFITSLPWQEGYEILVDGIARQPQMVNTSFLGFPLERGTHRIQLSYRPPLTQAGLIISVTGWCLFFLLLYLEEAYVRERSKP